MSGSTKQLPDTSVVVINRDGVQCLERTFPKLLSIDYPDYDVVFVDNNSSDGSVAFIEALGSSKVRIIRLSENTGISRAKNIGVENARGQYVWLLDNDISVAPDSLQKLVSFMEANPDCAISVPLVVNGDDPARVELYGGRFTYVGPTVFQKERAVSEFNGQETVDVSYPTGAVMFVKTRAFRDVGGFDEDQQFYLDDTDIGPRAWLFGWRVCLVPATTVQHLNESRAETGYNRWILANFTSGIPKTAIKHLELKNLLIFVPVFGLYSILKTVVQVVKFRDLSFFACWPRSMADVLRKLPRLRRQRQAIQARRVRKDSSYLRRW